MSEIKINRRLFIGGALFVVSATGLVGCASDEGDVEHIAKGGQFFNAKELTTLHDVSELMIPVTATPGAKDAQVAAVIDALMLSWASETTKALFRDQLAAFDGLARGAYNKDFLKLPRDARFSILEDVDKVAFSDEEAIDSAGYRHLKEIIFHVYYTSEQASKDYVPVPGRYAGNLTLSEYETLMQENAYGR